MDKCGAKGYGPPLTRPPPPIRPGPQPRSTTRPSSEPSISSSPPSNVATEKPEFASITSVPLVITNEVPLTVKKDSIITTSVPVQKLEALRYWVRTIEKSMDWRLVDRPGTWEVRCGGRGDPMFDLDEAFVDTLRNFFRDLPQLTIVLKTYERLEITLTIPSVPVH